MHCSCEAGASGRVDLDADAQWLLRFAADCRSTRTTSIAPNRIVSTQGEPIRNIFFVSSGCVRTFYLYPDGRSITLSYWTAGTMIGLPGLSEAGQTYLWSSETVEPTELLCVSTEKFQEWLASSPRFQRHVLVLMELKVRHLSNISQMLAASSIVSRLGLALQNLCLMHGRRTEGGTLVRIRLTHSDIAEMVGASRQWITRSLQRLRRAGIIDCTGRRIVVLRPDLLTRLDAILR